jgi:uncharacterized protein (DUF2147 family)
MNKLVQVIALMTTVVFSAQTVKAQASYNTPVGRWQTISDVTGKFNGDVEIFETSGELQGRLVAGRNPATFDTELCVKCPGDRHNQPMKGLIVMWGVHRRSDDWGGGEILDPDTGKIYRVRLTLAEGGKKLLVRGYIGFSLLGRTQTWNRLQ